MKKLFKQNKAFTLIETLVAISIFSISILAVMSVLASGISYTNNAKKKMIASFLAQEGIEYIRNMRDTYVLYPGNDWLVFRNKLNPCNPPGFGNQCGFNVDSLHSSTYNFFPCTGNPDPCKLYISGGSYTNNSGGTDSGFTRKIWMTDGTITGSSDEKKIFSKVEWTQGSGTKSVTFSANLFNLNP